MRVLHLSTFDTLGGAARSAYRVHTGLLGLGLDSHMLVRHRCSQAGHVSEFKPPADLLSRGYQRLRRELRMRQYRPYAASRRDPFQPFSDDRSDCFIAVGSIVPEPAVVNLYWVGGFLDYGSFFGNLPPNVPIVWRLSDMNAFTGGCHYSWDCERWAGQCGACPELGSSRERDLSRSIWLRKKQAYEGRRIHVVTPSRWLAGEVRRSSLLGDQPVTVIPNGLDVSVFAPRDRHEARAFFDVPHDRRIMVAGANYLQDHRKGLLYLAEALHRLPNGASLMVLLLGEGTSADLDAVPVPCKCLGYLEDDRVLARAYAAADFCVIPSIHESVPNMALEAMACGIPVVGFRTGGLPDVVEHGRTGNLARWKDSADLAAQIQWLIAHPDKCRNMGSAARNLVERDHTLETQAKHFAALYRSASGSVRARQVG
ncbi:glycosyltransferase family 4 protein [Chloroflexota bacterium]